MEVKAIDSLSLMNFEGKHKKSKHKHPVQEYPQMDAPASRKASKAMRNAALGGMLALATAGGMSSCTQVEYDEPPQAYAWAWADAWSCAGPTKNDTTVIRDTINHTDTIINTVVEPRIFKEYPFHVADSLIAQGLNIGVELDGPIPSATNNNVVFLAGKAHNRYDNIFYEIQAQDHGTTGEVLSTITKCVDMYDPENPKTYWIKSNISDMRGVGLRFENYVTDTEPNQYTNWGTLVSTEIRTNNHDGTNTVKIYDNSGHLVTQTKEGKYIKGLDVGTFMYETPVYDEDGTPYIDPDDGEVVKVNYDFDNGKMWSTTVTREQVPDSTTTYYYGTK